MSRASYPTSYHESKARQVTPPPTTTFSSPTCPQLRGLNFGGAWASSGRATPARTGLMTCSRRNKHGVAHIPRFLWGDKQPQIRALRPPRGVFEGCENKCASPYIGERFGENSVGGKWLIGAGLRIPLTLSGRGQGAAGG